MMSEAHVTPSRGRALPGFIRRLARRLPVSLLVARSYRRMMGKPLPLLRPRTLNEKLNWMKIFGETRLLALCADKVTVRDHVRSRIGDRAALPELYMVTDKVEDFTAEAVPHRQFVVKANHDCGSTLICADRDSFDFAAARAALRRDLARDYARVLNEPHYTLIPPRLLVEEYLANDDGSPLGDWRIMCLNGRARFLYVNFYHDGNKTRAYFDRDFRRIRARQSAEEHQGEIERPAFLDELFAISETLAAEFDFVRLDFNIVNGKIYFGEMTFTPQAGYGAYDPPSVDLLFGEGLGLTRSRYAPMRWLLRMGLVGGG